jgi:hypothetical protein
VLMQPYETAPLKVTIYSVGAKATDATVTKVCWAYNFQGGASSKAKGDPYSLASGIIDKGGSVIVAEVKYAYTPLIFAYYMPGITNLQDKFYLKPRKSSMIQFNTDPICTVT